MAESIPSRSVYPENLLFSDYVAGEESALCLFERRPASYALEETSRALPEVVDALRRYNARLGAEPATLERIDALRDPATRCVIGGHQAGFLGGPTFTAYKILSILRVAARLEEQFDIPVAPIFWLASEDHDVGEINRARFLEADGSLKTITFDGFDDGRPIEAFPITNSMRVGLDEALARFPDRLEAAALLEPEDGDDYATWHARIWSRLFATEGLILVEPRTIRPFAGSLHQTAIDRGDEVVDALREGANRVRAAGYEPTLDPERVGSPFFLDPSGRRRRIEDRSSHVGEALRSPERYSSDVALRPIVADALLPTIASVLGAGEISYHALLRPLYELFGIHQPVFVPRTGYTLLAPDEADLLERLQIRAEDVLLGRFDPRKAMTQAASPEVRAPFDSARSGVEEALRPLLPILRDLDPGLETRWRQASDGAKQAVDRLEERARGSDLARHGLSPRGIRRLPAALRPAEEPQERALSFAHFAATFGVKWLRTLPSADRPDRFAHYVVTIQGGR